MPPREQNYSPLSVPFRFEQPWWFLLVLAALPFILAGAAWMQAMTALRLWLGVLWRIGLVTLLAALIAGPYSVRVTNLLAVVAVVDVSGSVRTFAGDAATRGTIIDRVREYVAAATAGRGDEDLVGLVLFDGHSIVVSKPTRVELSGRVWDQRMGDGTDIAAALRLARSIIPPDAAGRILLISDGNQTTGDALAAAAECGGSQAGAAKMPVDAVTLSYRIDKEVSVEQVDVPHEAKTGSTVPVRVVLSAASNARGFLRLLMDDQPVDLLPDGAGDARPVVLTPGINIERFEVRLDDRRVHRFRAVYEPETAAGPNGQVAAVADTVEENNSGEAFTLSPGRGSVLVVDGVGSGDPDGPGSVLASTLRHAGLETRLVPSTALPGDLLSLQEFDAVVLQNVPADDVPAAAQIALAAYVQEMGGGLLMTGGPQSFGAGGWKGSSIEPLLPVKLDLPERLITSQVAIVFVLDNSGSMWHRLLGSMKSQQEIANDAAALAIRTLERSDQVGVITFNNDYDELIPLAPNADPGASAQTVLGIVSGGGTNAYPAIERAGAWLSNVKAKHKHIVVLSDGRSLRANDLPRLCEQLAAADIKVSTIGVGDDADVSTMALMARRGGGETYYVVNPNTLPQVFVKAVRIVRTPLIRDEPFEPVVLGGGSVLTAGISSLPTLGGLSLTQPRAEPTVVNAVVTPAGEPVFAHWQAGLGIVAAFTSDTHHWASGWMGSPAYEQFWSQVVRGIARPAAIAQGLVATARTTDGFIRVRLAARSGEDVPAADLTAKVTLYSPGAGGEMLELAMSPVGPGEFESVFPATSPGSYVALVRPMQGARLLPPLITGVSLNQGVEYRFRSSNGKLMEDIARISGGRVLGFENPRAIRLFDRAGIPPRESLLPFWHSLVWIAIAATLVDIANRRLAWDRWVSSLFGARKAVATTDSAAVAQRLSALRAAVDEREHTPAGPSISLGEMEARLLALEARDRRRAQKIAGIHTHAAAEGSKTDAPAAPVVDTAAEHPPQPASGLLAAKKRAGERFKDAQ